MRRLGLPAFFRAEQMAQVSPVLLQKSALQARVMAQFPRVLRRANLDLVALTLLLFVVNAPFLSGRFVPIHDTVQTFQGFHYFYSHFLLEGELPRWYSVGTFGTPSGFWQLVYLTPASYACMLVGRILHVESALPLFKLSLIIEQLILLVGIYKLSRLLFRSRASVFLVCVGVLGSAVWYSQIWWSLRIYYMVPLVLYFLASFFIRRQPHHLWLAAITFVISLVGNLMYFGVLWLFMVLVVVILLTWKHWRAWGSLFRLSLANLASFVLFLGISAAYLMFVMYSFEGVEIGVGGRDPETGKTPLLIFLTYGGLVDMPVMFHMLLFGWPIHTPWSGHMDNTVYMGLLPLALVGYALVKVRNARFFAFAGAALFVLWLSGAGGFARLMYYMPGFSLFRHLGLVYPLAKVLLLVCAGFGLDEFLARGEGRHALYAGVAMIILMDLIVDRDVASGFRLQVGLPGLNWWESGGWLLFFWLRMGIYAALGCFLAGPGAVRAILRRLKWRRGRENAARPTRRSIAVVATLTCFVIDLLLFQAVVAATSPKLLEGRESYLYTTDVRSPQFSDRRGKFPKHQRAFDAMRLMKSFQHPTATNETLYAFADYDRWPFDHPIVLEPMGVHRLILARRGAFEADHVSTRILDKMGDTKLDPALERVFGYNAPKFRLLANPIFAESVEEAARIIRETKALDTSLVLRGVPPEMQITNGEGDPPEGSGTVRVQSATANQVTVETHVTTDEPTWLVYSDSYHPDWRATVNGEEVPVAEAYLAFKAVPVGKGKSIVRFSFHGGLGAKTAGILAVLALTFCLCTLAGFVVLLLSPNRADEQGPGTPPRRDDMRTENDERPVTNH